MHALRFACVFLPWPPDEMIAHTVLLALIWLPAQPALLPEALKCSKHQRRFDLCVSRLHSLQPVHIMVLCRVWDRLEPVLTLRLARARASGHEGCLKPVESVVCSPGSARGCALFANRPLNRLEHNENARFTIFDDISVSKRCIFLKLITKYCTSSPVDTMSWGICNREDTMSLAP